MCRCGGYEGYIASQRSSGEAALSPSTVRFHPSEFSVSSSKATNREPRSPVNTTPLDTRQRETIPGGLAIGIRSSSGAAPFAPGLSRKREQLPRRSTKSSPSGEKRRRDSAASPNTAPELWPSKSQTTSRPAPAPASHRPSGENAA